MKRRVVFSLIAALVIVLITAPVSAADEPPIFYVRMDHTGCEDGSEECPFNTIYEARSTGERTICDERTFQIYLWNDDTDEYDYYQSYSGKKPVPPSGLPLAPAVQVALVATAGAVLLLGALYLRKRLTR